MNLPRREHADERLHSIIACALEQKNKICCKDL